MSEMSTIIKTVEMSKMNTITTKTGNDSGGYHSSPRAYFGEFDKLEGRGDFC